MLKLGTIIPLLCSFATTSVVGQNVIVTGAGSWDVNGTYEPCGVERYCDGDSIILRSGGQWLMGVETTGFSSRYSNDEDTPRPPDTQWQLDGGIPPVPTLSGEVSHIPITYVFTVNSAHDWDDDNPLDKLCSSSSGWCTLRAALTQANAIDPYLVPRDTIRIEFDIVFGPTGWLEDGIQYIRPESALPVVSHPTVSIDGTANSQGSCAILIGGNEHSLTLVIDGSNAGLAHGLELGNAAHSEIRGLVINNFQRSGVVSRADSVRLECLYVGTDALGTTDEGNGWRGVHVSAGSSVYVEDNLVSGNNAAGLQVGPDASDVLIAGNVIGTAAGDLTSGIPNQVGVVAAGTDVTIGHLGVGFVPASNVIAYNDTDGIQVLDVDAAVVIRGNAVYANGQLGIDIGNDGVTVNDNKDLDVGPNGLQNFPSGLFALDLGGMWTSVQIYLASEPGRQFEVELFSNPWADPSGYGEGFRPRGYATLYTDENGYAVEEIPVYGGDLSEGTRITATATIVESGVMTKTSEFSEMKMVLGPNVQVSGKIYLQGPWAGASTMSTGLTFDTYRPLSQPYDHTRFNGTRLNYDGFDAVPSFASICSSGQIVDWILFTLREGSLPRSIVSQKAAFLCDDGRFEDLDGTPAVGMFAPDGPGEYWLEVGHRNHIPVISSSKVDLTLGAGAHDFTTGVDQAYSMDGPAVLELDTGEFGLFGCNVNADNHLQALDFDEYLAARAAGTLGYLSEDCNLDGLVDTQDSALLLSNIALGALSQIP